MKTKCCIFSNPADTPGTVVVGEGVGVGPGWEMVVGGGAEGVGPGVTAGWEVVVAGVEEGVIIGTHAETCRPNTRIIISARTLLILSFSTGLLL